METKKLKEKLHEIETRNWAASEFSSPDPTDKKKKKRMHNKSTKKGGSRKPKSLKSKDKQVSADKSNKSGSIARKRTRYTDLYDDVEAKFSVMERAEKVLARLENELPHFVKCMLPSNVAHGFWLHLPKKFCSVHLPNHDTSIVLVDEWGNEYKTSYLLERHGLSAGWRGFSISHRLLKGDILIFHLTGPCKLQVHIVRVNDSDVVGAALCLMDLDASRRGTDADIVKKDNKKRKKTKYVEPFLLDISTPLENSKGKNAPSSILGCVADRSASKSDGFSYEVIEGSEITNQPQSKDLCYPKTSFLHEHARKGVICR
ncbi:B3 domain-containing protein [Sesamum alatum]|uniref:B3 domain-containing protein n=1 Tax=Sesamum alatum TaxID=300844 RepID=A0AAE2CXB7_9LAMI|nr:B3 domain-containing protein [Sesamum alatum]